MGPHANSELYKIVAQPIEAVLDEEYTRRNLVAPTLQEIDALFEQKDNTPNAVTEATLVARLVGLSLVQRSRMGINGFNPMASLDYNGRVDAKAAPYHDEYKTNDGAVYRTRVIAFVSPDLDSDVKVFGLNIYQPSPSEDEAELTVRQQESASSGFVIVDNRGRTKKKQHPIAGETVVFAVYNKKTQDAKYYQVEFMSPDQAKVNAMYEQIKFEDEFEAFVTLPDHRVVKVKQLSGELQQQANSELLASIDKLNQATNVKDGLSSTERRAVLSVDQ